MICKHIWNCHLDEQQCNVACRKEHVCTKCGIKAGNIPVRPPIVMIESPYAGDVETNTAYLRAVLHDCLMRGEAPFASHGLYTQDGVLDDTVPEERAHGIQAGFAFRQVSDCTVVYTDLGISAGMKLGIEDSKEKGIPVYYRKIPGWN